MTEEIFETELREKAQLVGGVLRRILSAERIESGFKKVLRYTLQSPGKRIRSVLVLWCCELVSGRVNRNAEIAAAAIEMVHTYSLIHDDLPAMDDDDFRRGRASCHKAFDEATAILAGDALLTLAFEVLARRIDEPVVAVRLIRQLAEDAGPRGMIAGQVADLRSEARRAGTSRSGRRRPGSGNEAQLQKMHIDKTAKMFRCAAAMGAVCGGANKSQFRSLCKYGQKVGLAFQVCDDILDVCGSSEQMGKTAGKDARAGKLTCPAVLGLRRSRQLAKKLAGEAVTVLKAFGPEADKLRRLAIALVERTR